MEAFEQEIPVKTNAALIYAADWTTEFSIAANTSLGAVERYLRALERVQSPATLDLLSAVSKQTRKLEHQQYQNSKRRA